ncbi:MAG: phosphoenolpyruvate synthase [Gemmatimonadota bacterium]
MTDTLVTIPFAQLDRSRIAEAGGKGANLGELVRAGIPVPDGFVVASTVYDRFLERTGVKAKLDAIAASLDVDDGVALQRAAEAMRALVFGAEVPGEIAGPIVDAYRALGAPSAPALVAVRSSATAEDTAATSFAGMFESFLNVEGEEGLLEAVRGCWASGFSARILFYRTKHGLRAAPSIAVVVQRMVQSDKSGVIFSVDPASRNRDHLVIEAAWGLGEVVVLGQVTPDRYVVEKSTGRVLQRVAGNKAFLLTRDPASGKNVRVDLIGDPRQMQIVLEEDELRQVIDMAMRTEAHYGSPQDMEFAVEGGHAFLVQSRPITTLGEEPVTPSTLAPSAAPSTGTTASQAPSPGTVVARGLGSSPGIGSGTARVIARATDGATLQAGEVLVAPMTSPDWVPVMRRAVAIVTDAGGMTSHAAIVSRELGIPCVVGTGNGTSVIRSGDPVTVDGSAGTITTGLATPEAARPVARAPATAPASYGDRPVTATRVYVNLADPSHASEVAARDVDGVGLLRAEFMLLSALGNTHPRVLIKEGRQQEFVTRMAADLRTIAAAFAPRPVVYRATDFRTNEFRSPAGGDAFEPHEENPMIGYRGCFRYTREPDLFALELEALAQVRRDFANLHLMIPFVRTLSELRACRAIIDKSPLGGQAGLQLWVMAEVPSVVYWLPEYAKLGVTGVSIGSNDLTQLMLGVDRDSAVLAPLFDERDPAVLDAVRRIIESCRSLGLTSSICGQAPSVHTEYVDHLVEWGIDSISVNPDVIERSRHNVAAAERKLLLRSARAQSRGE